LWGKRNNAFSDDPKRAANMGRSGTGNAGRIRLGIELALDQSQRGRQIEVHWGYGRSMSGCNEPEQGEKRVATGDRSFPPVVEVDGIWITLMKTTQDKQKDRKGRLRKVKVGQRQSFCLPGLLAEHWETYLADLAGSREGKPG